MKIVFVIASFLVFVYLLTFSLMYFYQEGLLFQSTSLPPDYKFELAVEFDELFIETEDGAKLNGLHLKTKNPKGIIVYYHGNAGDLSRWGEIVAPLLRYQYDVLVMDYRGYGKSGGKRSTKKMYADAQLWYREARKHFPAEQIVLYGRSLGCTFAAKVASEHLAKALILETPFYSLRSIVEIYYPFLPGKFMLKFKFPTNRFIGRVVCPILFLHGTSDKVVPYDNGLRLFDKAKGAKLITIEEGGHNNLSDFPQYWQAMDSLFQDSL